MKKLMGVFILAYSSVLMVCPVWAGPDEDAIRKIITDQAKALTDFPRSRDVQAVLKYFASDYSSVEDGIGHDIKGTEKMLLELEEQINLGNPVGISSRVSNINLQVFGIMAWATFDHEVKVGAMGEVLVQEQGKCTGIYRKKGMQWLIQHEHCSTPKAIETKEDVHE